MQVNQCGIGQSPNFQGILGLGTVEKIVNAKELPKTSIKKILKDFHVNTNAITDFYSSASDNAKTIMELSSGKKIVIDSPVEFVRGGIVNAEKEGWESIA